MPSPTVADSADNNSTDTFIKPSNKLLRVLEWLEETIIAYLLAAMVLLAFTNAVLRRLFNSGFFWSLEATLLLFLILVLFGMSYAARKSLHIGVDAIVNLFNDTTQKLVTLVATSLSIIYCLCMVSAAFTVFTKFYSNPFLRKVQLDDLPVPVYLIYLLLVVCFSYLCLTLLYMLLEVINNKRHAITSAHEASEKEQQVEVSEVIE